MPNTIPQEISVDVETDPHALDVACEKPASTDYIAGARRLLSTNINATSSGNTSIVPAIIGQSIRLYGWSISNAHTQDVEARLEFDDGTVADEAYLLFYGGQRAAWLYPLSILGPQNGTLRVNLSATGNVHVTVYYAYEDRPHAA